MIESLITTLVILVYGYSLYKSYKFGFKKGVKSGEDAATLRLLRTKNPEVWEVAHALDYELQEERKTDTHPVIKNPHEETTRKVLKK